MKSLALIRKSRMKVPVVVLVALVAHAAAGCSSDSSPTSPSMAPVQAQSTLGAGTGGGSSVLDAATLEAMNRGIQDEYHAEFVYMKVIEKFGDVQPFYNIVYAEQRHSEAIANLFTNRGLLVPPSDWNLGNVPEFASVADACAAGVVAELENIALYDELLTLDLPQDVRNVFTNIRAASLDKHLPAFQTCCACTQ